MIIRKWKSIKALLVKLTIIQWGHVMTLFHSDFLEAKLLESIRKESVQSTNTEFELIEYNASGLIIGGLVATVSYGWLLIKILWVDKEYRKTGIGRKLMLNAEKKAIQIGCHSV